MPITTGESEKVKFSHFWHPPAWKWGVVFLLVALAAYLAFRKPLVKVELLPFSDSPPSWNGSYPYLIVSPVGALGPVDLDSSILLIKPTVQHDSPVNEFRVDLHWGTFVLRQTDLFIPDVIPLSLTRTYRTLSYPPSDSFTREFGIGGNHPYDICPTGDRFPYTYMDLNLEDGRQIHFRRISKGTGYVDAVYRHEATSSEFYDARIAWNGNGWTLSLHDRRQFLFPDAYYAKSCAQAAAVEMRDGNGHRVQLKRDKQGNLQQLISPSGKTISFKYDDSRRIVEAADQAGNVRKYAYDPSGHLETVADATHLLYRFEYKELLNAPGYDAYLMTAVMDGGDRVLLRNTYRGGLVSEQKLANGDVYRYHYRVAKDEVVETIVDGPKGTRIVLDHSLLTRGK
jgi:YD repeat-containing protein